MINENLTAFFAASVGAAGAFIGLLFVGLTVAMSRNRRPGLAMRDRQLAESSYTALLNILFVSFVGLFPNTNLDTVFIVMGLIGVLTTTGRVVQRRKLSARTDNPFIIGFLFLVYAVQTIYGLHLTLHPHENMNTGLLITIMFSLYGIALGRAWALTGLDDKTDDKIRRKGTES